MAALSQSVNVMAIQLVTCEQNNEKPAADGKMGANAKNPTLLENPKKEKE